MTAKQLRITGRNRERMGEITRLNDFDWVDGDAVDATAILENPNISLYCFDHENQWAIFTVLPEGHDLSTVPFMYQAQYDHAQYLIAVPYEIFLKLADSIPVVASNLICIHNIGRCGSTLLSNALNQVQGVYSLSEPDIFTNFIIIRNSPTRQQIPLLQASFKMIFRPAMVGDASRFVIKFRNQCADIISLFADAFPDATHLFMYRNTIDWLASFHGYRVRNNRTPIHLTREEAIERYSTYINRSIDEIALMFDVLENYSLNTSFAVSWIGMLLRYLDIYEDGFRPLAIRYEDLKDSPTLVLEKLFEYLNLPIEAVDSAMKAFEKDSQAGTILARQSATSGNKIQLPDSDLEGLKQIFAGQPVINHSDIVLPGTLMM